MLPSAGSQEQRSVPDWSGGGLQVFFLQAMSPHWTHKLLSCHVLISQAQLASREREMADCHDTICSDLTVKLVGDSAVWQSQCCVSLSSLSLSPGISLTAVTGSSKMCLTSATSTWLTLSLLNLFRCSLFVLLLDITHLVILKLLVHAHVDKCQWRAGIFCFPYMSTLGVFYLCYPSACVNSVAQSTVWVMCNRSMMRIVSLLSLLWSLVEVHSQTVPYVSFMSQTLANHSYVDISLVGRPESGGDSVQCHTDLTTCCSGTEGSHRGDWYFLDN